LRCASKGRDAFWGSLWRAITRKNRLCEGCIGATAERALDEAVADEKRRQSDRRRSGRTSRRDDEIGARQPEINRKIARQRVEHRLRKRRRADGSRSPRKVFVITSVRFVARPVTAPDDDGDGILAWERCTLFRKEPGLCQRLACSDKPHLHAFLSAYLAMTLQVIIDAEVLDRGRIAHRIKGRIEIEQFLDPVDATASATDPIPERLDANAEWGNHPHPRYHDLSARCVHPSSSTSAARCR
jgi:hypothetical protein